MIKKPSIKKRLERAYLYHPGKMESGIVLCGSMPRQDGRWYDYSPYGNHGVITGALWTRLSSGMWGLIFDGSDDVVTIPHNTVFNLSATAGLTLACWFNPSATNNNWQGLINKGNISSWGIRFRNTGAISLSITEAGVGRDIITSTTTAFTNGTPYFLVITYILGNAYLYLNNTLDKTQIVAFSIDLTNDAVTLGRAGAATFNGVMGESYVLNRVWSTLERTNHWGNERHLFRV